VTRRQRATLDDLIRAYGPPVVVRDSGRHVVGVWSLPEAVFDRSIFGGLSVEIAPVRVRLIGPAGATVPTVDVALD